MHSLFLKQALKMFSLKCAIDLKGKESKKICKIHVSKACLAIEQEAANSTNGASNIAPEYFFESFLSKKVTD